MSRKLTRKEFFRESAKYALGISAGVVGLKAISPSRAYAEQNDVIWPLPYTELNPDDVLIAAHDAFWSGNGCSYGAFHGIVSKLREALGTSAWDNIPTEIMIYGHGGTVGWGTLCGALNGAAALISAVTQKADSDILINELVGWYTITNLPTDKSNQFAVDHKYNVEKYTDTLPQNISDSPLCHSSVSQWCNIANHKVGDIERKERCARLTGDTAAKAVEILNAFFANNFTPTYTIPEETATCLSCHGSSGVKANVASKMHCQTCHGDPHSPASIKDPNDPVATFELKQNYPNPFNPTTTIEFSIKEAGAVTLTIYDINGRKIKELISRQLYIPGTYQLQWDGTDQYGKKVSSGMYFYQLQVGKSIKTRSMMLIK